MHSAMISRVKKKISHINRRECDQEITVPEIEKAIKSFESNKSSSNNSLPAEFYIKLLMKYLKKTYISCILKFHNLERCRKT